MILPDVYLFDSICAGHQNTTSIRIDVPSFVVYLKKCHVSIYKTKQKKTTRYVMLLLDVRSVTKNTNKNALDVLFCEMINLPFLFEMIRYRKKRTRQKSCYIMKRELSIRIY